MNFKEYFSHDYYTRNDYKIKMLIADTGMEGYGVYWAIIEDLYSNNNSIPNKPELISKYLNASYSVVISVINDFNLFQIEGDNISCNGISKRLGLRVEKSNKLRENAKKRWSSNANDEQLHSNSKAIKENKIKENKIKENKIKSNNYKSWSIEDLKNELKLIYESGKYPDKNELINFFNYWSEANQNGKLRFTLEKTWNTELRVARWFSNKKNYQFKSDNKNEVLNALNNTFNKIIENEY